MRTFWIVLRNYEGQWIQPVEGSDRDDAVERFREDDDSGALILAAMERQPVAWEVGV